MILPEVILMRHSSGKYLGFKGRPKIGGKNAKHHENPR